MPSTWKEVASCVSSMWQWRKDVKAPKEKLMLQQEGNGKNNYRNKKGKKGNDDQVLNTDDTKPPVNTHDRPQNALKKCPGCGGSGHTKSECPTLLVTKKSGEFEGIKKASLRRWGGWERLRCGNVQWIL